jgi:hypothetical protein
MKVMTTLTSIYILRLHMQDVESVFISNLCAFDDEQKAHEVCAQRNAECAEKGVFYDIEKISLWGGAIEC